MLDFLFSFGKKKVAKKVEEEKEECRKYARLLYEGTQRMTEMGLDDIEIRTPGNSFN